MSVDTTTASRPIEVIACFRSLNSSVDREQPAMSAPCLASSNAIDRPMPRPAPVTTAVFPERISLLSTVGFLFRCKQDCRMFVGGPDRFYAMFSVLRNIVQVNDYRLRVMGAVEIRIHAG